MTVPSIVEAIRSLNLHDGQPKIVEVDGRLVRLSLEPVEAPATANEQFGDSDAQPDMVAWFDLTSDMRGSPTVTRIGKDIPFDPPIIPDDALEAIE